jgi:hypothetical protein
MALGKNVVALLAHLAAVKEFCLYCCSVTYTLILIRYSGVLDSGGGVLAKAFPSQTTAWSGVLYSRRRVRSKHSPILSINVNVISLKHLPFPSY